MNSRQVRSLVVTLLLLVSMVSLPLSTLAAGKGEIAFSGKASYAVKGKSIKISVEKLKNSRSKNTGPLRFTVWATKERYDGGTIKGFVLGRYSMPPLGVNYNRTVTVSVAYTKPPKGSYLIVMTADEKTGGEFKTVDYIAFDKIQEF